MLCLETASAQPGAGVSGPVSLHHAVRAASARAASPIAAMAAADAARERAVAAAQLPDPALRLSLDSVPVEGADRFSTTRDFMTARSISLMQTFTRADKRSARAEHFRRGAEVAQAERLNRFASVQRETAIAWLKRHAAEQALGVLEALRDETSRQIEATEAALRGGRAKPADVLMARDALAKLDQTITQARAELANSRRALARWTGDPPDRPLAPPPAWTEDAPMLQGIAERQDAHPDLLRLLAGTAEARAAADVARAEREPDWSAELMFSQRGSRYANMVSIGVTLPLPWDRPQRQDRELAARLAQAEALRAEREELARERRLQTESWMEAWHAGLANLALIDRERMPLAKQRIEAALAAFRGGQGPLSAVLDARLAALALRLERIDLELQTAQLWARVAFLVPREPAAPVVQTLSEGASK
ncbi:MAG TPA: TolC family protein [Rubrivivax sp.]|nr:TolC family protein [Rubrivivax sp.]